MEKLENIPIELNLAEIQKKLRLDSSEEAQALIEKAQPLLKAKAAYRICYVEARFEDAVVLDGARFNSRVLRINLEGAERAFLYVVTIGHELEETAGACGDLLRQYYLDVVGNMAVSAARKYLEDYLARMFGLGGMSRMNPGSLADWPIREQKTLFSTLGDVEASIGVRLTGSCLMIPRKSVSGIYFPTEVPFLSCQLCPRENCPSRRAAYDKRVVARYGIQE